MANSNDGWADAEPVSDAELAEIRAQMGDEAATYNELRRLPGRTLTATMVLWSRGYSFGEIAQMQGYSSPAAARMAIESAVASSGVSEADRDLMRTQMKVIMDQHHMTAFRHSLDDKNPEQGAWMKLDLDVLARKAKLLGLDAPQVSYVKLEGSEFEQYAAQLAIANGADTSTEVDPFAVDDDEPPMDIIVFEEEPDAEEA